MTDAASFAAFYWSQQFAVAGLRGVHDGRWLGRRLLLSYGGRRRRRARAGERRLPARTTRPLEPQARVGLCASREACTDAARGATPGGGPAVAIGEALASPGQLLLAVFFGAAFVPLALVSVDFVALLVAVDWRPRPWSRASTAGSRWRPIRCRQRLLRRPSRQRPRRGPTC